MSVSKEWHMKEWCNNSSLVIKPLLGDVRTNWSKSNKLHWMDEVVIISNEVLEESSDEY